MKIQKHGLSKEAWKIGHNVVMFDEIKISAPQKETHGNIHSCFQGVVKNIQSNSLQGL